MNAVTLPWPPAACSPNARVHWSKKSRAARAYRAACHLLAKQAGMQPPKGEALLILEFVPPDKRRRDDDNLLAMFKAGRDGIADALGVDDSIFATQIRLMKETTKGGAVRVRIQAIAEEAA